LFLQFDEKIGIKIQKKSEIGLFPEKGVFDYIEILFNFALSK